MCTNNRGPICGEENIPLSHSLGPTGILDISTKNNRIFIPQKHGVQGLNTNIQSIEYLKKMLKPKLGTCEFYEVLSKYTPGDREYGYYWNYGRKYCRTFNESILANDDKASRWIDCVTINLQREILNKCLSLNGDLQRIKRTAYTMHARIYTDCGICELDKTFIKQLFVIFIPDFNDIFSVLGYKQIKEAVRHCIIRPFYFNGFINRYISLWNLDEKGLANDLSSLAKNDPVGNYALILGVMEMLSNTCDDDDVAEYFIKSFSSSELDLLAKNSDGRRILYMMKSALKSGILTKSEKELVKLIGNNSRR